MIVPILAPNPGPFTLEGTQSYVIDETAIIDPGPVILSHIAALADAAPNLKTILITHRHADHAPAAAELRRRSGAAVLAPEGVTDPRPDRYLHDGESIDLGRVRVRAVATPGHTSEHLCFVTDEGDLFSGDTILGFGTTTIFPPDGDMSAYFDSLQKLRALQPRRIYPGHGPVRDDAREWIDYYIEHRFEREREILGHLRAGPAAVPQLRKRIYPDLNPALVRAAELQVQAHLTKLVREHRVDREGETWRLRS